MRRMKNPTQPLYLSLPLRAAIVRAYRPAFTTATLACKPRRLTISAAMRVRAQWLSGEDLTDLARRHLDGRVDHMARLLSGVSFTSPSPVEAAEFNTLVGSFYEALAACDFGPLDALPGKAKILPLEKFLRGEAVPAAPVGEDDDEGLAPADVQPTADSLEEKAAPPTPYPLEVYICTVCGGPVHDSTVQYVDNKRYVACPKCGNVDHTEAASRYARDRLEQLAARAAEDPFV